MTDSVAPSTPETPVVESPSIEMQILSHKATYTCPRFKVNETIYRRGSDEERKTYKIELTGDLLVIIPRFKQKIVLVSELHPPSPDELFTFPTGFIVAGMPIGDTAQTILTEKTGCAAQKFHPLGSFHPSRYIDNIVHVMAADGLTRLKESAPELKDKVQLFTEQEIGSLLIGRDMYDGLALASYVYYATSNYFAEVHRGSSNSNNTGKSE